MFVLGCGSREWKDSVTVGEALSSLPAGTTVVHGDQFGADLCVDSEAQTLGLRVLAFPADWNALGGAAGPARNQRMLEVLLKARKDGHEVRVLAFHEDPGLGIGTKNMVRKSLAAKIPVIIYLRVPWE